MAFTRRVKDAALPFPKAIKEELRSGKGMKQAVAAGYGNAFSAIFDSNLTSLITGKWMRNYLSKWRVISHNIVNSSQLYFKMK